MAKPSAPALGFVMRDNRSSLEEETGPGVSAETAIRDEEEREQALMAMADEIRARAQTPRSEFLDGDRVFSAARARLQAMRGR